LIGDVKVEFQSMMTYQCSYYAEIVDSVYSLGSYSLALSDFPMSSKLRREVYGN